MGLVLAVGFVFYTAYASATIPHPLAWAAVIVPALFSKRLLSAGARTRSLRRLANYQRERLRRLEGEWRGSEDASFNPAAPEHPYAGDLDLFGEGSLYEYLSTARTGFGRQTLGQWLLEGAQADETEARQRRFRSFATVTISVSTSRYRDRCREARRKVWKIAAR